MKIALTVLRWLAFLPLTIALAALLNAIPIYCIRFAQNYTVAPTLFSIAIAVLLAILAIGGISYWFYGTVALPHFGCRILAPHPQVASVIFGTAFAIFEGFNFIYLGSAGATFWLFAYHALFTVLILIGTVFAYQGTFDETPANTGPNRP